MNARLGRRRPVTVRMPTTFRNKIAALAENAGMSLNDYMIRVLADRVGFDLSGYRFDKQNIKDR